MTSFDITERLPFGLSFAASVAASYSEQGVLADVVIAGLPFRLAVDSQHPYVRKTYQFKRQQIDTSREAGEQSLSSWWVRDQTTWHRGAGVHYYEPGSDPSTVFRYESSVGVDVWVQGQAQLLRRMDSLVSTTAGNEAYVTGAIVGGSDVIFGEVAGTFFRHDGSTKTDYSATPTPASTPVVAGSTVLCGSTSGVLSGSVSGSSLSTLWTTTTGVLARPWWVKSRILCAQGADLHDLTLTGGDLDADTPLWTHPDSSWTWTAVAEAPDAILAAGYSQGYGTVYSFGLSDNGTSTTPVIGAAMEVATLPPGEEVYSLATYLGAYVAVGTSRGVRIGTIGSSGAIALGPLSVTSSSPVEALVARDSYFYATITDELDGDAGCARIDISAEIPRPTNSDVSLTYTPTLRYAWAYDADSGTTGTCHGIAFLGLSDRIVLGVQGAGVFLQSSDHYVTSGHITSGRVRYATAEPKSFRSVKVRSIVGDDSTITLATVDSGGSTSNVFTFDSAFDTNEDIGLAVLSETVQQFIQAKLTLTASTDALTSPVLREVQFKATPQPKLQRELHVPLYLIDMEADRRGQLVGYQGSAVDRLQALELIEEDNSVVLFTDHTSGESFSAQIDDVQMVRMAPPSRNNPNFGGIVTVTLVTV